jgi:hypothetical protein
MVVTGFGLSPGMGAVADVCAWADAAPATNINVAASIDLMRSLGVIDVPAIKHICLVGTNTAMVQETSPMPKAA